MNSHFLIKMTDMLHRIRLTIIKRESRLIKSPRKARTLYSSCERRFSNLVQRFVHGFVSKDLVRWALILRLWPLYSLSHEKISLGGVLDRRLYVASFVSSEEDLDSGVECPRHARRNFFFSSSISRCMSLSSFAWETWLLPRDWILLVCVVCTLPSWFPLCWGFTPELLCWEPPDSAWCRLSSPWCGAIFGWCEPDSSIFSTKPRSPSDQIKLIPTNGANCKDQFWLGLQNRCGLRPNKPKQ